MLIFLPFFVEGVLYNDLEDMKNELIGFLVYYNEHRPHSALDGKVAKEVSEKQKCN